MQPFYQDELGLLHHANIPVGPYRVLQLARAEPMMHLLRERCVHCNYSPAFLSVEPLLEDLGKFKLAGIGWMIVGGESGPRSRPMFPDWVRRLSDQCLEERIPFFFKHWGGTRKQLTGRTFDGKNHDEFPPMVESSAPGRPERFRKTQELLAREVLHT